MKKRIRVSVVIDLVESDGSIVIGSDELDPCNFQVLVPIQQGETMALAGDRVGAEVARFFRGMCASASQKAGGS